MKAWNETQTHPATPALVYKPFCRTGYVAQLPVTALTAPFVTGKCHPEPSNRKTRGRRECDLLRDIKNRNVIRAEESSID